MPVIPCSSDAHEAGVVSVGPGERAALSGSRSVHERGGAAAGRLLRGSGHTPARVHPSLIRPVPGQARLRGVQRAPAHVALLHEGSVFGGRRLAAGSRAGVFPPEAARVQELALSKRRAERKKPSVPALHLLVRTIKKHYASVDAVLFWV